MSTVAHTNTVNLVFRRYSTAIAKNIAGTKEFGGSFVLIDLLFYFLLRLFLFAIFPIV